MPSNDDILEVQGLQKSFPGRRKLPWSKRRFVHAVQEVSFTVGRGEVLGVIGESGSGKSTVGRTILGLLEPDRGEVKFEGSNTVSLPRKKVLEYRRKMQIVFQDPYSSLNPRQRVSDVLSEPLEIHNLARGRRQDRVAELLELVGLPASAASKFPHEFSGGQRQRIGIARALAVEPDFVVADEPVSALDVSIQAQIIALLESLQKRLNLSMLIIAHDLALVQHISDRILVMYLGRVMEILPADELVEPHHPYTWALLSAAPRMEVATDKPRLMLGGDIPSPANPPSGCVFRTRCPFAVPACAGEVPKLAQVSPERFSACIRDDLPRSEWRFF